MANRRLTRWQRFLLMGCITWIVLCGVSTIGETQASRAALERPIIPCPATNDGPPSLAMAQQLYDSGCYPTAIAMLETLSRQGDALSQAVAFSNLALAHQKIGQWDAAKIALELAFERIAASNPPESRVPIQAQTLEVQGQLYQAQGQAAEAAQSWQRAADLYIQMGEPNRAALSQIRQAQALQSLGLFQQVQGVLQEVYQSLVVQPDRAVKAVALRQLADALWITGQSQLALAPSSAPGPTTVLDLYRQSRQIAEQLGRQDLKAAAELNSGNFFRNQFFNTLNQVPAEDLAAARHLLGAFATYGSAAASPVPQLRVRALLNLLSLQVDATLNQWLMVTATDRLQAADYQRLRNAASQYPPQQLYETLQTELIALPPGQSTIFAYLNLTQSLMTWASHQPEAVDEATVLRLLQTAEAQARSLGDQRSLSYIAGQQGQIYYQRYQSTASPEPASADLDQAEALTRQALTQAQSIGAQDISYQWQRQLGQVLAERGQRGDAIAAYTEAFNTLQLLRTDLVAANADQQFSFRDNIAPIYRELIALLLPPPETETAAAPKRKNSTPQTFRELDMVRRVMDALQVAELENFFSAACVDTKTELGSALQPGDAGLYPIVLEDRLEIVLQLPTGTYNKSQGNQQGGEGYTLQRFSAPVSGRDVERLTDTLRDYLDLSDPGAISLIKTTSQELYRDLFGAVEVGQPDTSQTLEAVLRSTLAGFDQKTLVFVLDGPLRPIPLGALYDGQHYLLENYALALNLGIEVRESEQLPGGEALKVLAAGVEFPPAPFDRAVLPRVPDELNQIAQSGVAVNVLREEAFTENQFNQQLNRSNYQVVHLATHGQFASTREDTYILAKDGKIPVNNLSTLFRTTQVTQNPVELIIFSACRTAAGDNRAVLGLAGATVQAGARSAIAALWSIDDGASVPFAEALYQGLGQAHTSRAVALQQAQLALKAQYDAPRFWAPYVLIGSWH